ncbi:hypothetical protein ABFX02_11G031200 [Erythranthe guttata]
MGKLVVRIVENGHSYRINCDEHTPVESVQKLLESISGIPFKDQLLFCFGVKLESHSPLSAYKLPSGEEEVFLFNKSRMRINSPPPTPEKFKINVIPINPPLSPPSSSRGPHPNLDDTSDPALNALPSYETQFRNHLQSGSAIYRRTLAMFEICERLLQEQEAQERALDVAKGNLDHFYKMVCQNYTEFMKCYSQQDCSHRKFLVDFGREKEKLRSIKIMPLLQNANRKCLLDFVDEENLQKVWEECSSSHGRFEKKVLELKTEFGDLNGQVQDLFSCKTSNFIKDVELSVKEHRRFMDEQKSIMQALSEDVNTVKKLLEDYISRQVSPSPILPHNAFSALGPTYNTHEKDYLPKMRACDNAISTLLDLCTDKKNESNLYVHNYMQKIARMQYIIKDLRYKFSVFSEALKHQNEQFHQLKVLHGVGPAYMACLAEVERRKTATKMYMENAEKLSEKLARERDFEIRRRDEFVKVHSTFIPPDILASMGLYDSINPCYVNVAPLPGGSTTLAVTDTTILQNDAETKIEALINEVSKFERESEINRNLLDRLRSCATSADFADSLRVLAQSLVRAGEESNEDSTFKLRECIEIIADKVGALSRQCEDLEENRDLANKERISFNQLQVDEIAAFLLNASGQYQAINRDCPYYYLSPDSISLLSDNRPSYIIGQVVHIERRTVESPLSETGTGRLTSSQESTPNPYGLPIGCEYFVVTTAILPDTNVDYSPRS